MSAGASSRTAGDHRPGAARGTAEASEPSAARVPGPLAGIRVLDLTRVVAGPYATAILADLGARVVKIEDPKGGDVLRRYPDAVRGMSLHFNDLNRGKESVALDLRTGRGREMFLALLPHFDVLVENFSAGTLDRLGLPWPVLERANPRLVAVSLSGFGESGPYAGRRSYDLVVQAMSGLMDLTGLPDGPPLKAGVNLADYVGGLFMAIAVLATLVERDRSGRGQRVEISNHDAMVTMLDAGIAQVRAGLPAPERHGNAHRAVAPYNVYRARDGWIAVASGTPRMFTAALRAIGRADLLEDPGFLERARRWEVREEVDRLWAAWVAERSCAEVERVCEEHGIAFGRVLSVADLARDPHLAARGMLAEVPHPDGGDPLPTIGTPFRFSRTPARVDRPAPRLGEHTAGVLAELLSLSATAIEELRTSGVAGAPEPVGST